MNYSWHRVAVLGALFLVLWSGEALASQQDEILRERRTKDPFCAEKDAAEGRTPPPLVLEGWLNTEDQTLKLEDLAGRVVLVDFFSSKDAASKRALAQVIGLAKVREAAGLTVIGIHVQEGGKDLAATVEELSIPFPVAWDRDGKVSEAWMADGTPDYWLIGRDGRVRVADLADSAIGSALGIVLAEGVSARPDPSASIPRTPVDDRVRDLAATWPSATFGVFVNGERLGNYVVRNRIEEVQVEGQSELQLVLEDELHVLFHSIELNTKFRNTLAVDQEQASLVSAAVQYEGGPLTGTTAVFNLHEYGKTFLVRGQRLNPRFPVFTEAFLTRAPALSAVDFDPEATYSWMNFVDGRMYDGVFLRPSGQVKLQVLGQERTCQRWILTGEGQAAPSFFDFDEHGMLLHALLEQTVEYVLERAPEGSLMTQDSPPAGDADSGQGE